MDRELIKVLYEQALILAGQENNISTTNLNVVEIFAELLLQEYEASIVAKYVDLGECKTLNFLMNEPRDD